MTSSSMRRRRRWSFRRSSFRRAIRRSPSSPRSRPMAWAMSRGPIGAFVLGHWGDTHGRKNVLIVCMFLMGISTMAVGLLPTYQQVGMLAPVLLVVLRLIQGFAVAGEISGASSMILEHAPFGRRGFYRELHAAGRAGRADPRRRRLPAARRTTCRTRRSTPGAGAFRSCSASSSSSPATSSAARSRRRRPSPRRASTATCRRRRSSQAFKTSWPDMLRVVCMALMNVIPVVATIFGAAYAVQPAYGIGFRQGRLSVDPGARQHPRRARHPVRRQSVRQDRPQAADHRRRARLGPARPSPISTRSASRTCRSRSSCRS